MFVNTFHSVYWRKGTLASYQDRDENPHKVVFHQVGTVCQVRKQASGTKIHRFIEILTGTLKYKMDHSLNIVSICVE